MKNLYILISIFVITLNITKSQSFDFMISPNSQNVIEGITVVFDLEIIPLDNFNATVVYISKEGTFSENYLNIPYKKVKFSYTPSIGTSGLKIINIVGKSGTLEVNKQCTVLVSKNTKMSKIKVPRTNTFIDRTLYEKDKDANLTLLEYGQDFINLHTFINEEWNKKTYITDSGEKFYNDNYRNYQISGDSIWYHTDDKLILVYNNYTFIYNSENSEIKSGLITGIKLDKNGNPLIFKNKGQKTILEYYFNDRWITLDSNIYHINSFDKHFNQSKIDEDLYNQITFDKNNNLWIKNIADQLVKIVNNNGILESEIIESIDGKPISADFIKIDNNEDIWFIDNLNNRLVKYDYTNINIFDFPLEVDNIYRININNENNIWFLNAKNLIENEVCSFNGGVYKNYSIDNIFSNEIYNISNLFLDVNNNVWINSNDYENHIVFNPNGLVGVPIISSVENNETQNHISIFPNPVNDLLNINLELLKGQKTKYKIFDLNSKLIDYNDLLNNQIDVSKLPKGAYILEINNSDSISMIKFIKE